MKASEVAQVNVQKREYQKAYLDYWQTTANITGTGLPVDGVFSAAAPHAAVIPHKYRYTGYTTFVNILDYTSLVIPTTNADKTVDTAQPTSEFLSETDRQVHSECKYFSSVQNLLILIDVDDAEVYDGAPVGIQLIGRRLEEERILTLAEYISQALTS